MRHALVRIISFQPVGGHELRLVFDDGHSQVVDFLPLLHGPLFEPLREPAYFAQARLDPVAGTLVWPNGADFDPDTLHACPGSPA